MKPRIYFRAGRWRCEHPNTRWIGIAHPLNNTPRGAWLDWKHRGRHESQWGDE